MSGMSSTQLETKVRTAIATVLDVDLEEVHINAGMVDDLGTESLDYLDLVFNLEREFNIRLPHTNILTLAEKALGDNVLVVDGRLTDRGLRLLRQTRPEIDPSLIQPGLTTAGANRLITPRSFVRLVARLLEAKQAQLATLKPCPKCGKDEVAEVDAAPEFSCGACGEVVPIASGDDVLIGDILAVDKAGA